MVYTFVAALMLLATVGQRQKRERLGLVLRSYPVGWSLLLLVGYAIFGSYMYPRLYAGEAIVFVNAIDVRAGDAVARLIKETTLEPVSGNVTQTGYFCLSLLSFFAVASFLVGSRTIAPARRGLFAFAIFTAGFGAIDFAAKIVGIPDIFEILRTATYSMATEHAEAGFWRIVGGFPEASSYSMTTIPALAFAFTYWRHTGSKLALSLVIVLSGLILISTSTTAYMSLVVLGLVAVLRALLDMVAGRIGRAVIFVSLLPLALIGLGCLLLVLDAKIFDAFASMLDRMVLQKSSSQSALERGYWNEKAIEALFATDGLGIGIGSSRASSFIVAYISQLGIVGVLLFLPAVVGMVVSWRPLSPNADLELLEREAVSRSSCSAALGWLVALSVSAGSPDPGVFFFATVAIAVFGRRHVARFSSERPVSTRLLRGQALP